MKRRYQVVVWGAASQNTTVVARSQEEAERIAVAGFRDGSLAFDEPMFGHVDADAEAWPARRPRIAQEGT